MKNKIELGKEYNFAGYRWVPVRINEENQVAIMQSLGVTAGLWPGYSMSQFGNGYYCSQNISSKDISDYDNRTRVLMEQIRPIVSGDTGLYLPSYDNIKTNSVWRDALAKAAANYRSFGASSNCAWTGTYYGGSSAYSVYSNGDVDYNYQSNSFVVPVVFNLDLSKIGITSFDWNCFSEKDFARLQREQNAEIYGCVKVIRNDKRYLVDIEWEAKYAYDRDGFSLNVYESDAEWNHLYPFSEDKSINFSKNYERFKRRAEKAILEMLMDN